VGGQGLERVQRVDAHGDQVGNDAVNGSAGMDDDVSDIFFWRNFTPVFTVTYGDNAVGDKSWKARG
jgi:hypothetical protein